MQGGAEGPAGACSGLWHLDHIGNLDALLD